MIDLVVDVLLFFFSYNQVAPDSVRALQRLGGDELSSLLLALQNVFCEMLLVG